MLGSYKELFEAQSTLESLRSRGGGIVTCLLIYAINNRIVNEALVVRQSNNEPWAEPVIARTPEEVMEAAGSKYTFIPQGALLKKLGNKSAVVGLPCQIRELENKNILLKLGLFCGLNLSPRGLNYLLRKINITKDEIEELDYRAPGGGLLVELKDGTKVSYNGYSWLAYFFSYKKCLYCTNYTNHYADISVGDRRSGWSNVIIRTDIGKEIFARAVDDGLIRANPLTEEEFLTIVMSPLFQKELRGGYINTKLVRVRGKWIEYMPLRVLRLAGNLIYQYTKRSR